ncbi:3-deoxy-D-manno-octulosonic acid transferase [Commensalibacter oyaizuii]|uniref:3-deoxy-D-manno-octulosonic acid transferase n=1 Tax=Commensalibacter oyaizuii TaxID=3043873 RepID=A0ABT6Q2B1_9PROT|nr:glycosyltransferase N-terminal domain-containing protein [Commensalibacter sp. TBRC 16381]MDI2091265.1 glycosyltransferase N-terminal domain-containing protein [Commensalibacter sp. TBRC 16381]
MVSKSPSSFLLIIWAGVATLISPLLKLYLKRRCYKGKEIKERLGERMGYATLARPDGEIIHFHAASVGEVISIFPIIHAIYTCKSDHYFLITTGTVTSYHIVQQQFKNHPTLSKRILHQFVPLDIPKWIKRFVQYWHPSISIIVESELWPNLITQLHHHTPVVLINARLSDKSFSTWCRFPKTAQALLTQFTWIAARSAHDQHNLQKLGIKADFWGDLKQIAPKLPYDSDELQKLKLSINAHPVWLAASTHTTEELFIAKVHQQLKQQWPDLITIIVPRHPERRNEIVTTLGAVPQRSLNQPLMAGSLYLWDTLGELGLLYRLCDIVFIGNSINTTPKGGGHNPFEPARLHCAMATGTKIHNFKQAYDLFGNSIAHITTVDHLTAWVGDMIMHPEKRSDRANQALQIITQQSKLAADIADNLLILKMTKP